jgi:hypothetical protein
LAARDFACIKSSSNLNIFPLSDFHFGDRLRSFCDNFWVSASENRLPENEILKTKLEKVQSYIMGCSQKGKTTRI